MSPDWAGSPSAVPYANLGDPQSLNLYAYVDNNPIMSVDGDGHNIINGVEQVDVWGGSRSYTSSDYAANTAAASGHYSDDPSGGSSGGGFKRALQRLWNAVTGMFHHDDPVLHEETTTVVVDMFGNLVVQAGANYSIGGAGFSWVPSTGNIYGTGTLGTPGTGVYAGAGPTTNLDQSGPTSGVSGFYGLGGGRSWSPSGDTTDLLGFSLGIPGVGAAGGYTKYVGSVPAARFNVNILAIPAPSAISIGDGLYTQQELP